MSFSINVVLPASDLPTMEMMGVIYFPLHAYERGRGNGSTAPHVLPILPLFARFSGRSQPYRKRRAVTGLTVDGQLAAQPIDDFVRDGQSQPRAWRARFAARLAPVKPLEEVGQIDRRNARAGV